MAAKKCYQCGRAMTTTASGVVKCTNKKCGHKFTPAAVKSSKPAKNRARR